MPGSATANIRDTFGATFIGLLFNTSCVFSRSFSNPVAELAIQQPLWSDGNPDVSGDIDLLLLTYFRKLGSSRWIYYRYRVPLLSRCDMTLSSSSQYRRRDPMALKGFIAFLLYAG
jgi:hypothetical protein